MCSIFKFLIFFFNLSAASYHEQYRVPQSYTEKWESYVFSDKEYLVQNLAVSWENARILCRGYHNGTLAVLDTRDRAEFLAEALSESQFSLPSVWVGARRDSAEDPAGYRWAQGMELRRTALDVLPSEREGNLARHYPAWLNRTHVPVPDTGADCVALERVYHDSPVFLDLPCHLERPFACEREAHTVVQVVEMKTVRCRNGLYHIYDGRMDWHQAAAYCVLRGMNLANIQSMRCLRRLGMSMLKTRPSIENAWIGARGSLGKWTWSDTGLSIFQPPVYLDVQSSAWPPMSLTILLEQMLEVPKVPQWQRYGTPGVFTGNHCRSPPKGVTVARMCAAPGIKAPAATSSDDMYYYVLVKQLLYWQHAYENCLKLNGTLASIDNNDILIQLLLVMGENKEEPVEHVWISGRLNMSKDVLTDTVTYSWYNPINQKRIPDPKSFGDTTGGIYMPPWLDEEFTMDSSCLNLDRQDHLVGLVYGLPCDTPQYSVCLIEKTTKSVPAESIADTGYDTS